MRFYELLESNGHYLDSNGVEVFAVSNSVVSEVIFGIVKAEGSTRHLFHKEKIYGNGFVKNGKNARNYLYFLTRDEAIVFNNTKLQKAIDTLTKKLESVTNQNAVEHLNKSIENLQRNLL